MLFLIYFILFFIYTIKAHALDNTNKHNCYLFHYFVHVRHLYGVSSYKS